MPDKNILRDAASYAQALADLLPRGDAWSCEPASILQKLVAGLAAIWADIHSRAFVLLKIESHPGRSIELLRDWEKETGLPDNCFPETLTIAERQLAVVARLTFQGGASRVYFLTLAQLLGYSGITIKEYSPFMCGLSGCGEVAWEIGHPTIRFYWKVKVPNARLTWFRCGSGGGQCGQDPMLNIVRAVGLECVFNRWKPAHTIVIFDYSGV